MLPERRLVIQFLEPETLVSLISQVAGDKPIVTWCMELDTLRADLGLFGFPSKDVHFKFLCNFTPVFYLRQRAYSKSVPIAPFVVNYNGALFRTYPSGWQACPQAPASPPQSLGRAVMSTAYTRAL
jgi:hypothetical protein